MILIAVAFLVIVLAILGVTVALCVGAIHYLLRNPAATRGALPGLSVSLPRRGMLVFAGVVIVAALLIAVFWIGLTLTFVT